MNKRDKEDTHAGRMHARCAVADDTVIMASARLICSLSVGAATSRDPRNCTHTCVISHRDLAHIHTQR